MVVEVEIKFEPNTCSTCKFWYWRRAWGIPEISRPCKRRAPSLDGLPMQKAAWPFTSFDNWCGDYTEASE